MEERKGKEKKDKENDRRHQQQNVVLVATPLNGGDFQN